MSFFHTKKTLKIPNFRYESSKWQFGILKSTSHKLRQFDNVPDLVQVKSENVWRQFEEHDETHGSSIAYQIGLSISAIYS